VALLYSTRAPNSSSPITRLTNLVTRGCRIAMRAGVKGIFKEGR
jgi:hypothetical protein